MFYFTDQRKSEQIVVCFQSSLFQILKPLSISCEIIKLNSWRGIAFSVIYGFLSKYQANSCVPTNFLLLPLFFFCLALDEFSDNFYNQNISVRREGLFSEKKKDELRERSFLGSACVKI